MATWSLSENKLLEHRPLAATQYCVDIKAMEINVVAIVPICKPSIEEFFGSEFSCLYLKPIELSELY